MSDEEALLPCPFCGGAVEVVVDHTTERADWIRHKDRHCGVEFSSFSLDEPLAVAWNRRASISKGHDMNITINGKAHWWSEPSITHEQICELAGKPLHASVTYFARMEGDAERSGLTYQGKSIQPSDGMVISCMVTGNA